MQEELQGVLQAYEKRGYFDEVLSLMEAGLSLERAHVRSYASSSLLGHNVLTVLGNRWVFSRNWQFFTANIVQRNVSLAKLFMSCGHR